MSGPTMYKGKKLQEALKVMIREATGDAGKMTGEDRVNDECKTAVFAMARHNLNAGLPTIFRSYTVTANPSPNCAIWQALYATMAHPELFKGVDIIDSSVPQSFVGGELGCSNPLAHVLSEVKQVHPDLQVACIISIGAGHARTIQVPNPSRWNLATRTNDVIVMKEMVTDSERVAQEMALRFQGTSGVYFRFNVDQGMQNMKNGSWERLAETLQHTKAYLQKSQTGHKLEVVKASTEKHRAISTTHAAGQITDVIEVTKRPTGFRRCPAPTKLYTGRKDENGQIIACITGNNRERRVCVVYGLGGIGKTQLVLNAIERTWDEWDCIIYVDASSAEAIEEALEEFAEAKAIGQSYNGVISLLESCGERWLIVFDNADDPSTNIRKYVPTRGRGCSVIITTRLPDLTRLAGGPNSLCHLSSTNQTDGMALLVKIDFECLALAIVHAGAYIVRSPSMTITKYRDLFLSQRRRMLEEYSDLPIPAKLDDYGDIVYTTWRMCYDQLKPESRALLWLIAYLHYDGISEDIFRLAAQNMHNPDKYSLPLINLEFQALDRVKLHLFTYLDSNGDWDTVAFIRIMADLTSYSLIDFDKTNLTYRVHVLVHDWARTVIPQGSDLAIECTATLLSLSVGSEEDAVFLAFKRRLGLRVTSVLVHNPNIGTNHCDWLRHVYEETGQWSQQAQLDQQVLWAFQRELGDGNVKTWRIMNELAVSYAALGQWDVAERLQVQAVDAYKQLWGKTHPETLKATGALAGTYFHMGQLEEAERLQIQVLDGCKKLRGEEHPETSIAMSNLTNTYSSLNRCNEAEQLQVQVLYVRVRDLGEEHPRTLTAMNNLAATYSKLGQWNEAGELYLRCITIAERVLGDQHPRVELYRENLKKTLAQGYKESDHELTNQ